MKKQKFDMRVEGGKEKRVWEEDTDGKSESFRKVTVSMTPNDLEIVYWSISINLSNKL